MVVVVVLVVVVLDVVVLVVVVLLVVVLVVLGDVELATESPVAVADWSAVALQLAAASAETTTMAPRMFDMVSPSFTGVEGLRTVSADRPRAYGWIPDQVG